MKKPYQKEYNEKGEHINALVGDYTTSGYDRKERRASMQKSRFMGNGKGISLTVTPLAKYRRQVQIIGSKRIEHYLN